MSVPSNEQWKYRNSVPQINLLTPCQPPNQVQFSRDWNFYLSPQELVTPMSPAELAAYDKSLAPSLNQLRMDSSVQNFSQITVSRKTVATDDQNSAFTSTLGGSLINDTTSGFNNSRFAPNQLPGASNGVYNNTTPTTDGAGVGAVLTVTIGAFNAVSSVVVTSGGSGYAVGDTLTIPAAIFGATADLTIFIGNDNVSVPVNTASISNNGQYIPTVLQTQEDVSLAGPKWIKPPVNGVSQLALNSSLAGLLVAGSNFAGTIVQDPGTGGSAVIANAAVTSSGAGVGATLSLTVDNFGFVTSITVISQGSGYQVGDSIFVSSVVLGGSANNLEIELIENSIAQILTNGGFDFPIGVTRDVKTQSVTGCGVGLTVAVNAPEGSVTGVVICNEGEEYKTGDVITIINPNEGQLSTAPDALLSSIILPVFGATPSTYTNVPLVGGSGSGASATIVINALGAISPVTVTAPGSGYKIGDELQVLNGQLGGGSSNPKFKLEFGDVASNATISVDILAPSPLATTQTDGFIQMDQGGFQLPTGPWGAQLGIVSLTYSGGSINGTSQSKIVVETCQPHGLNSCDKVTINGVDQFGGSNHFDVVAIHDANKFEINNPYEYGTLPSGPALNALVVPHRKKSSIDQAGLSVPYRSAVSKTIHKQVFSTTELYACTEVGCNNQNYDFNNVGGQTGANGVPAQSIYSDPPPILQPQNFRGPVATSFGVTKQLNASELATLQLNSVPFPL